jgi:hypothetical protein
MSAIATSADGEYLFMACEDASTGFPVIVREARDTPGTFTAAYSPGAGAAANVAQVLGNPDQMLFYGNFGTDVVVIRHTVSTGANEDISPASLGAKVVNGLAVNPANADEIIITVNTDQDLLHTDDAGANWETYNAALGFDATALVVLWQVEAEYHLIYAAGQVTGAARLLYSPNNGAYLSNITGANLVAAANVVGLEAGYVA